MTAPVYGVTSSVSVALSAATARSVLSVLAGASFGLELVGIDLGTLGVTATEVPLQIEICKWDGTGAGAPPTEAVITQLGGMTIAEGFTAFQAYTAEPSALTVMRRISLTPNSGTLVLPLDPGEFQAGPTDGFALRLTAPATVSVVPGMQVKRI